MDSLNMQTREEILNFCLSFPSVCRDQPFHDPSWDAVRLEKSKKIFALIFSKDGRIWVNVKTDPKWRDLWRSSFSSVVPAYHMNKEYWNSIILDGTVPNADIRRMIAESYDLVSGAGGKAGPSDFAKAVYREVKKIPQGRVATYGQIARLAGRPGAARAVGSLMRNCPPEWNCPCHRVISGSGRLAPEGTFGKPGTQKYLLEAEGIQVTADRVDLHKWQM